jgi:hypothetical protein
MSAFLLLTRIIVGSLALLVGAVAFIPSGICFLIAVWLLPYGLFDEHARSAE